VFATTFTGKVEAGSVPVESKSGAVKNVVKMEPTKAAFSPERADQMLTHLKKTDPNEAARLEKLRTENPERFWAELHRAMRAKYSKDIVPIKVQKEKEGFKPLADRTPKPNSSPHHAGLPDKAYEQHRDIKKVSQDNSLMAENLKEELRVDEQIKKKIEDIKKASDDTQKQKLTGELKGLVGKKVDLNLKKKRLEHEQTLIKLAKLQEQIKANEAELKKQESADARSSRIDAMMKDMLSPSQK
jgi:hypothetical protein